MSRSLWKGPFVDPSLLKFDPELASLAPDTHSGGLTTPRSLGRSCKITGKIWSRRSCILPQFVGSFVQIYNGRSFVGLKITEEMVGHKFGEFASTRKTSRRNNTNKGSKQSKQKA